MDVRNVAREKLVRDDHCGRASKDARLDQLG